MAKPETYEQAIDLVWQDKIRPILINRQRKYGEKNISDTGLTGIVVRSSDKTARLRNLVLGNGADTDDESIEDTLTDQVGYGIIGLMWLRGLWGLPLEVQTAID